MQRCLDAMGWTHSTGGGGKSRYGCQNDFKKRALAALRLLLLLPLHPLQEYGLPSSHTLNTLGLNYMFVW